MSAADELIHIFNRQKSQFFLSLTGEFVDTFSAQISPVPISKKICLSNKPHFLLDAARQEGVCAGLWLEKGQSNNQESKT